MAHIEINAMTSDGKWAACCLLRTYEVIEPHDVADCLPKKMKTSLTYP